MDRSARPFPLVADGEPVSTEETIMSLYNDEDLISNIHGAYQEKNYEDVSPTTQSLRPSLRQEKRHQADIDSGKSYAKQAREQAKVDVKKKRQTYLTKDIKKTTGFESSKKTAKPKGEGQSRLSALSKRLHQDHYILAELPKIYKEPNNKAQRKSDKNNYDFLKTSQIYNPKPKTSEKRPTQELNLARFEG
ncbi:hypothetical protein [Streptococcus sp. zg-JUN1979]|uniref:hypothetical protein n=1 Tax=Streptococcus sp. zg-JUN1979 TaxID=3391450 RepID=UPI0039A66AA0